MMSVSRNLWPYDEVTISRDAQFPARFIVSAPWLKFYVDLNPVDAPKVEQIAQKLAAQEVGPQDLPDINWLFTSLASYPIAYILPRSGPLGADKHRRVQSTPLDESGPRGFLLNLGANSPLRKEIEDFAAHQLPAAWTWDTEAALGFSTHEDGFDPESLFSIARRFHLLNDIESNKTAELIEYVNGLKADKEKFLYASGIITRGNHYVTEKCDSTLKAALPLAQNAKNEVLEFVKAESGHDRILGRALKSMGLEPAQVPVIPPAVVLMEVFKLVAERSLLGFAMVVDIFERTSYREEDPLTSLLNAGGQTQAGKQIDIHRQINDAGEHENVALGFLSHMAAVDQDYATEALRMAELATLVSHRLSVETLKMLQKN